MSGSLAIILAAFSGAAGVVLGAFGAHGLRGQIEDRLLETFQTAVQYQLFHAVTLLFVGLLILQLGRTTLLSISAWALFLGIVLFSGSLYGLVFTGMKWLGPVTPLGGLCFIVGWLALAGAGFRLA